MTISLFRTVSEINGDFGRKSHKNFPLPARCHVRECPSKFWNRDGAQKNNCHAHHMVERVWQYVHSFRMQYHDNELSCHIPLDSGGRCLLSDLLVGTRLCAVVKVVLWSRGGAHLAKPGWSKPHTHSNPTNLALFRHKITLYRFNQGGS